MRRQLSILSTINEHGGSLSQGKRKVRRPVVTKRAMHLVLKSSKAIGVLSLHRESRFIEKTLRNLSAKHLVKVLQYSNSGNHLHLVIQARTRNGFRHFVTALSGMIAQKMMGSFKGRPHQGKFWDFIPYTRILEWGRDLRNALEYVVQNYLEERGLVTYHPRQKRRPSPN